MSKLYKNPHRNEKEMPQKYVPEYQSRGLEPVAMPEIKVPANTKVSTGSNVNPRLSQRPYIEIAKSQGKVVLPNVGNNMEHFWTSMDGVEVVDDLSPQLDPNHPMLDNNDFVSNKALGFSDEVMEVQDNELQIEKSFMSASQLHDAIEEDNLSSIFHQLDEQDYVVLVVGEALCSGNLEYVQEQVRALVFGEHSSYFGKCVNAENIDVFKKIPIKIGVFLNP